MTNYLHLLHFHFLLQCLYRITSSSVTELTTVSILPVDTEFSDSKITFQPLEVNYTIKSSNGTELATVLPSLVHPYSPDSNATFQHLNEHTSTRLPEKRNYAYLYQNLRHYFLKWYLPLVLALGIFGTVFCLIFLFLSRLFPVNMLIWLVSICVGDFFILILEGIWMLLKVWWDMDIRDFNTIGCKLHTGLSNYMFYWSAYMQTMLSLQRAYLILRPIQARSNGPSLPWLLLIWVVVSVLLVLPVMPYAIFWDIRQYSYQHDDCDPPIGNQDIFRITTLIDFVVWGIIPLTGMSSATAIICWNIFRVRHAFGIGSSLRGQTSPVPSNLSGLAFLTIPTGLGNKDQWGTGTRLRTISMTNPMTRLMTLPTDQLSLPRSPLNTTMARRGRSMDTLNKCRPFCSFVGTPGTADYAHRRRRNQGLRHGATDNAGHVTRLLICMNIWYVISTFPLMIYLMILNFSFDGKKNSDVHRFLYYLSRSLCFLNACSNWIFYCASGRLFRQRIKRIIRRFFRRLNSYSISHNSMAPDHACHIRNQYYPGADRQRRHKGLQLPLCEEMTTLRATPHSSSHLRSIECLPVSNSEHRPRVHRLNCFNTFRRFCCLLPKFQCHCFCVSPFRKQSTEKANLPGSVEDDDDTKTQDKCALCCTGFCCRKFWWYGLKAGRIRDESFGDIPAASSSSSAYCPSKHIHRHSQLCLPKSFERERENESLNKQSKSQSRDPGSHNFGQVSKGYSVTITKNRPDWFHSIPADLPKIYATSKTKTPPYETQIIMDPVSEQPFHGTSQSMNCYCYTASIGKRQYRYFYCKLHDRGNPETSGSFTKLQAGTSFGHLTTPIRKLN